MLPLQSISSDIVGFTGDEATRRNLKLLIKSLSRLLWKTTVDSYCSLAVVFFFRLLFSWFWYLRLLDLCAPGTIRLIFVLFFLAQIRWISLTHYNWNLGSIFCYVFFLLKLYSGYIYTLTRHGLIGRMGNNYKFLCWTKKNKTFVILVPSFDGIGGWHVYYTLYTNKIIMILLSRPAMQGKILTIRKKRTVCISFER